MTQYIDKSAMVAEIENRYNECLKRAKIIDSDYWNANADAYRNVLAILNNTLEVKEVDLTKEIDKELETRWRGEYLSTSKFRESAKHFFELGMQVSNKARKGE